MAENKVKFGIKNVHAALLTEAVDEQTGTTTYTYGTPHPWPGAVSLSLAAQGGSNPFYADDRKYYVTYSNTGYEGDLETALVPEWVLLNIFGDQKDAKGAIIENANATPARFALLFEIDGDVMARRVVLYDCTITRPAVGSTTKTDTTEVQTETCTITAVPRADGSLRASTTPDGDDATYNGWFSAVYEETPIT